MSEKIVTKEISFPRKANKVDYFKAAVFYIISDSKPVFIECEKREKSHLENAKLNAIIKKAVPGYNSTIMKLAIDYNINEYIIDDENLDLNQKIIKIADSIRKYVQVSA